MRTAQLAAYVGWEELSRKKVPLEQLRAFLGRVPRQQVVFACSLLNAALGTWGGAVDLDEHEQMLKLMFSPHYARQLNRIARFGSPQRYVFHRQQLLFLAREAIVHGQRDTPDLEMGFPAKFGFLCLVANDLLPLRTKHVEGTDDLVRLLPEMITINDYAYRENILGKIARTRILLEQIAQEPQIRNRNEFMDISALFESTAGISLRDYSIFTIGALSKYLNFKSNLQFSSPGSFYLKKAYFQVGAARNEALQKFLEDVSSPIEGLVEPCREAGDLNDFTALRDRPLLEIWEGSFAPVDVGFLADKLESGIFWRIHDRALEGKKDKEKLHTFWGHLFQAYVTRLLQGVTGGGSPNELLPAPDFERAGEACDAVITCSNSTAIFFEFKSSMLTATAKYSGSAELLVTELQKKFVGKPEKPKGVLQLANAITRFGRRSSPEKISGLEKINTIYPVLIAKDYALSSPLVNRYLNEEFKRLIVRKDLRLIVCPLFVLTIYELENISPYLIDTPLVSILEAKYRQDKSLSFPFLASRNEVLDAKADRTNLLLQRKCDEAFDDACLTFFGKTFKELRSQRPEQSPPT